MMGASSIGSPSNQQIIEVPEGDRVIKNDLQYIQGEIDGLRLERFDDIADLGVQWTARRGHALEVN